MNDTRRDWPDIALTVIPFTRARTRVLIIFPIYLACNVYEAHVVDRGTGTLLNGSVLPVYLKTQDARLLAEAQRRDRGFTIS